MTSLEGSTALQALVRERLPRKPYCGETKVAKVRPIETAIGKPFLQLNRPCFVDWLIIDIDRACTGYEWYDRGLPAPTFVVLNPDNRHQQIGYALAAPVCKTHIARQHPLQYLAAIKHAYCSRLGGDPMFNGPLSKNPLYTEWHLIEPANAPQYELAELAEFVTLPRRLPKRQDLEAVGLSRNCTLFDELARWSRRAVRQYWRPGGEDAWHSAIRDRAHDLNTFTPPLPVNEVNSIARSVGKWTWRHTTPSGFREWQASMGRRGGLAKGAANADRRAQAVLMAEQGMSQRRIAAALDVSQSAVRDWLRAGGVSR